MAFDRAAALRGLKPQRPAAPLVRRPHAALPYLTAPSAGRELLLDTTVYIDVLQGRTPAEVDALLGLRIVNHSAVALAELTHPFGRLDPADPRTRKALAQLSATLGDIPPHRLFTPSARVAGEAGMLAGLIARLTGKPSGVELLNDALLFLQAGELGCSILTRNAADFDLFDQVLPGSGPLFYRDRIDPHP